MDEIRRDIEESQPLLGPAEPIDVLLEQYKGNAPFLPKILVCFLSVACCARGSLSFRQWNALALISPFEIRML
jgi:hypothetical protein